MSHGIVFPPSPPQPRPAVVTRFAPSPTGLLHLGHAHSALAGWTHARRAGGWFLLRMEDIDPVRCRPEFITAIEDDLGWLGLDWDGPVLRQSQRMALYAQGLARLQEMRLLYPCFCTRKDIEAAGHAPHGPDGPLYPGLCRGLSPQEQADRQAAGQPFALRLDMTRAIALAGPLTWTDESQGLQTAQPELFGDVVLARKDAPASYHLAVVIDDHAQGVSLVTRGQDLFAATHVHCLLQALLGLDRPHYAHHCLLTDEHGRRYAKRDKSLTLRALREAGKSPADVRAMAGF